jgi:branched-chain amino acid transport system ATP-binding protein
MKDPSTNSALPISPLLRIEKVTKAFGGICALQDLSFDIPGGAVYAVIGPNGAGKTTLFNLITGACAPDSGRIIFEGKEIQGRAVYDVVALGIARTFQNVELFESMTALENVLVGRHVRTRSGFWSAILGGPSFRREEREARRRALEIMEFAGIADLASKRSGDLAFGWQRFLEIARALAAGPRLLLLDEPAAGLNAVETQRLGELIRKIRDLDITIVLVEHDMNLTMDVSDRLLVLNEGKRLAEGAPREIQMDEAVMDAYLGRG